MLPTTQLLGTLTVATCLGLAAHVSAQTTRPAAQGAELDVLTVDAWTCSTHDQIRMPARGACPICETELRKTQITIQGGEVPGDPYPLSTCPISGQELGAMGPPIVMTVEGREVRFCCAGCIEPFQKNAAKRFKQIDARIVEQQLPYYPMTSCPVSQQPLGSMGEPVNYVHNNRLVRFCCKGCVRMFKKDPAAILAVLDRAVIAQQMEGYPIQTCPISKQKLGSMGEPVDYVVANRLVRFCCAGCPAAFNKAPAAHLAKLDEAWGRAPGAGTERE